MENIQNFNYHTHTERCGHAEKNYGDEEYVKEACQVGIKFLAFTDHIPFQNTKDIKENIRMPYSQVDEYIQSIRKLKNKYKGKINIETGFEFEYMPKELDNILKLKSKVDKMILGQHFIFDREGRIKYFSIKQGGLTDKEMIQYVCLISKSLENGLPDIIAHPDLFLKFRKEFGKKEEFITRQLCNLAEKYGVPMEINLNEVYKEYVKVTSQIPNANEEEKIRNTIMNIKYPNKNFWQILSEYKEIKVLYGIDAHYKGQILNSKITHKIVNTMLGNTIDKLNFVDYDFQSINKEKNENESMRE